MDKPSCCAHLRLEDGGNVIWFCCELEKGHVGRHQDLQRQDTKERNWFIVLWDADVPYTPNSLGLCPRCGD